MANLEIKQSTETQSRFFYGYIVVAVAFFIMVVMIGAANTYGVFLKPMLTEFGWSRGVISGALSVSHMVRGLLSIAMGGLTDRFGPRLVLTLGAIVMGLGYLLMTQISAVWQLYLFYGLIVGAGLSGVYSPLLSTVVRWFVTRRSMMTGIVTAGAGVGTLIMAPLVSQLITAYGWRVSFSTLGSMILVFAVVATQFLKRDPTKVGQVAYGEGKRRESRSIPGSEAISLKRALHTSQLWIVNGISICLGFSTMVIIVHIVAYVTDLGISVASAANVLAITGGVSIAGRIVLGTLADRIGNKRVFLISFVLITMSFLWLLKATDVWMLYLFAAVFGFAFGGSAVVRSPLLADLFGVGSHGLIFGITDFSWSIGGALGPLVAGYLFDVTGSYQVAFLICAAAGILGLILTWTLPPIKKS